MRDTISHLQLKLAEAEEDTSCAALNRLRAKLRELMKDGQKADQQVSTVERSMQTLLDRRESYEDLRTENERLQAELTQIRRTMKEVVTPIEKDGVVRPLIDEEGMDASTLLDRLRNCEVLLAELRMQLDVKTAHAETLQSELESRKVVAYFDRTAARHEITTDEEGQAKEEPEELDEQAHYLLSFSILKVDNY